MPTPGLRRRFHRRLYLMLINMMAIGSLSSITSLSSVAIIVSIILSKEVTYLKTQACHM